MKSRLKDELERLNQEPGGVRVLASAAPGTDIICHELCRELGIKSTICLPMPADKYSTETFKDLDGWRSRFLALIGAGADCLRLSDAPGLPRWLQGPDQRMGTRQPLGVAIGSERRAPKVALIAVWDGERSRRRQRRHRAYGANCPRGGQHRRRLIKLKDGAIQS